MIGERFTKAAGLAGTLLFACFGLFLIYKGVVNIQRARASASWPKTEAVITKSATVATTSRNSDRTTSTSYSAELGFQYQVNGVGHTTSTRHFGQTIGTSDSSDAELLHLRYPEGGRVTVYYDPADPAIAVTEPGFQSELLWLPGAGLFLLFPALMFMAFIFGDASPGLFDAGISMFGGIFLALGAIALFYGGIQIVRGFESANWPRAEGQIVYAKVDTTQSSNEESRHTVSTSYGTHLVFQYAVAGRTYFSNLRNFAQLSGSDEDWAREIAARYPQGKTFPVSYSPTNPQLAVLEAGFSSESLWLPGIGLVSLLFGLAVVIFARRALSGPAFVPLRRHSPATTEKHKRYH